MAIPQGAKHLRLLAQNTAAVQVHFHGHAAITINLLWRRARTRWRSRPGILAALVQRVDAGTGDVSLALG